MTVFEQTKAFAHWVRKYFRAYGGWRAVFTSPVFLIALIATGASYSIWLRAQWVDMTFSIMPNLLGFSLGTYAVIFTIWSDRVREALKSTGSNGISNLEAVNASFVHFILMQALALFWAIFYSGTILSDIANGASPFLPWATQAYNALRIAGSFVGNLLLYYSVALIAAGAIAIYRLALLEDN